MSWVQRAVSVIHYLLLCAISSGLTVVFLVFIDKHSAFLRDKEIIMFGIAILLFSLFFYILARISNLK